MEPDSLAHLRELVEESTLMSEDLGLEPTFVSNVWMDPGDFGDSDPFEVMEKDLIDRQRAELSDEW